MVGWWSKHLFVRPPEAIYVYISPPAAQAFLHNNSQLRRTSSAGGSLEEPLGDVRDRATLRGLAVELRMEVYSERVATKMQERAGPERRHGFSGRGDSALAAGP